MPGRKDYKELKKSMPKGPVEGVKAIAKGMTPPKGVVHPNVTKGFMVNKGKK